MATTLQTRLDLGSAIVLDSSWRRRGWAFEGTGCGLEIAVQLDGDYEHVGSRLGAQRCRPGDIHIINQGEPFRARAGTTGRQVAFVFYPHLHRRYRDLEGVLEFRDASGRQDRRLTEIARWIAEERPGPDQAAEIVAELDRFVERHGGIVELDPVLEVKRELDRHFDRRLYVEHLAEAVGMHAVTLARKFKRRFGRTPVRYRLEARLNHAGRLTWSRPDLSVGAIAEQCGFEDMPFFHRQFARYFGTTPARFGRRPGAGASTRARGEPLGDRRA